MDASLPFFVAIGILALGAPAVAALARGRTYGIFSAVVLALALPGPAVLHERLIDTLGLEASGARLVYEGLWIAIVGATFVHLVSLVRARLRSLPFRVGISIPAQVFLAAGALTGVWLLALLPLRGALALLGADALLAALRWLDLVPLAVAVVSVYTSTRPVREWVRFELGVPGPDEIARVPVERHRRRAPEPAAERRLRVAQISDTHLGPWQPVRKLTRHVAELLERDPDLVLLTGDFLTMEGNASAGALREALAPLRDAPGRCFAIFGNHDHEAPDVVRDALLSNGVRLLVDEEAVAKTPLGAVQIVGADYVGRDRESHIQGLLERFPRRAGHLRLLLLHDPLGFHSVPPGEVDLVLSGHTHGGQLGLVSLGLDWTVLSRSRWPDHGLFARGASRLYVHRGSGFYGFPLRIGVPGEASILELLLPPALSSA